MLNGTEPRHLSSAVPRLSIALQVCGIIFTNATRGGLIRQSIVMSTKARRQADMTTQWPMPMLAEELMLKVAVGGDGE